MILDHQPHYAFDQWQQQSWHRPRDGRRYHAVLKQTLFGDWIVVREWWGVHSKRRGHLEEAVDSYEDGLSHLAVVAKRREQHGYKVS